MTHINSEKYLTVIDCGPSRFTIWKKIKHEDATTIARELEEVFRLFGPPKETIFDNGTAFRSSLVRTICDKWDVAIHFRCADRPSGNAIVERCHRTIKQMAARRGGDVLDAVVLYNVVSGRNQTVSPSEMMMGRKWENPILHQQPDRPPAWRETERHGPFEVGDWVWVKPPNARCGETWREGRVTRVISERNVEIDGMPRHPKDLRRRSQGWHYGSHRVRRGGGVMPIATRNDYRRQGTNEDVDELDDTVAMPSDDDERPDDGTNDSPEEIYELQNEEEVQERLPDEQEPTQQREEMRIETRRRSSRTSRLPTRYHDFIMGDDLEQLDDPG